MGAGDRSGMAELIKMIKTSKAPIICICNDRQSQKIRSLAGYCLDLRFRRPTKSVIARRAVRIGSMEGMHIEQNAAEAVAESCGNDIRQILNCMQMWSRKQVSNAGKGKASMTYKDVKDRNGFINKDEILRINMFDATKQIIEGPKGMKDAEAKVQRNSLYRRCDAYFVDYSLMGLNVHQNYLKVMIPQMGAAKKDEQTEEEFLERMQEATSTMSDFAVAEHYIRSGDQVWSLLPLCSVLTVKSGYHAAGDNGGFLAGYPEFAGWMGKNSTRSRKKRLLHELDHHMNYRVSGGLDELRQSYIPALRERFLDLMMNNKNNKIEVEETVALMDEYGLDRDDLFENLDEFAVDPKAKKFSDLESKDKAAFTRQYNQGVHKSQALVDEQGVTKGVKRKAASSSETKADELDVVNDDKVVSEDENEDEQEDTEAILAQFKKKKAKKSPSSAKKTIGGRRRKSK